MSDEELSPGEALAKRHRKEKKDLQAKIQQIKKSASKGDKKKKKEVSDEITRLENEMKSRHEEEIKALTLVEESSQDVESVCNQLDSTTVSASTITNQQPDEQEQVGGGPSKLSKAEKRRQKKEQDDLKREAEIKAAEEANRYGPRNIETQSIKQQLKDRGLTIHDIPSNGDCMFNSILHQSPGLATGTSELRRATADELLANCFDYLPFMTSSNGEPMTQEEFDEYCQKMASQPTAWGSQVELRAIAQVFGVTIEVVQGEGPVVVVKGDREHLDKSKPGKSSPIVVTFHKHYFGLGEHYNSTKPVPSDEEQT